MTGAYLGQVCRGWAGGKGNVNAKRNLDTIDSLLVGRHEAMCLMKTA